MDNSLPDITMALGGQDLDFKNIPGPTKWRQIKRNYITAMTEIKDLFLSSAFKHRSQLPDHPHFQDLLLN